MNGRRESKIIDFIKSPFGAGALIVLLVFVALIIVSIVVNKSSQTTITYSNEYGVTSEYDPASETIIMNLPPTNGEPLDEEATYVATYKVVGSGVPVQHWVVFKSVIEKFAKDNDIDLFRVSYLHDSYKLAAIYVFDFKVVLNIDQQTIGVRIDASKNRKDILGSVYTLSDEAGNELYRFEVTEENKCQFDGGCSGS